MERLAPLRYRDIYPRVFGLWAGHLDFCPSSVRHWLAVSRPSGRDGAVEIGTAVLPVTFQFWWEVGLERNLVFAHCFEVKTGALPAQSEAVWAAFRLTQLFGLCTESELVLCHSRGISRFWVETVREILNNPRSIDIVK